jgi:hypothetical protein
MRMRLRGRGWSIRRLVLFVRLGERFGHESLAGDGPCADRRADQECAASFIMLAHACLLPVRYELVFTGNVRMSLLAFADKVMGQPS